MSRVIFVLHIGSDKDDLVYIRTSVSRAGGVWLRSVLAEVYIDKIMGKEIDIPYPYVLATYKIDDSDALETKAVEIMQVEPRIRQIIIYGYRQPTVTKITLPKITTLPVSITGALMAGIIFTRPFERYSENEIIFSVISLLTAFGSTFVIPYMAESSKRKELKKAYDTTGGTLTEIEYGNYDYALNTEI